jgi:hypothetical protein
MRKRLFWRISLVGLGWLGTLAGLAQQSGKSVLDSAFSWIAPTADTVLVARQQQAIRWRWSGDAQHRGTLAVQYTGETAWQTLVSDLRLADQRVWWSPPDRNQTARLRLVTPAQTYLSDTLTVVRPIRPQVLLNCPDRAILSWVRQPGVVAYQLVQQGPKSLIFFRQTTDTVAFLAPTEGPVVAIWPVLNGKPIRLDNAIDYQKQGVGCYTTGWGSERLVADTARLYLTLSTTWDLRSLTLERATAAGYQPLQTLPILPNQLRYDLTDRPPAAGATRYRIRLTTQTSQPVVTDDELVYSLRPAAPFVFPNPVGAGQPLGLVTLDTDEATATWLTPDGRVLQTSVLPGLLRYVPTTGLPPGLYLLRLEGRMGTQRTVPVLVR